MNTLPPYTVVMTSTVIVKRTAGHTVAMTSTHLTSNTVFSCQAGHMASLLLTYSSLTNIPSTTGLTEIITRWDTRPVVVAHIVGWAMKVNSTAQICSYLFYRDHRRW